jgi:hypothetical protein
VIPVRVIDVEAAHEAGLERGATRRGVISGGSLRVVGHEKVLAVVERTPRTNVGFQPCFGGPGTQGGQGATCTTGNPPVPNPLMVNEGHDSAMEFAEGNFGLLQGALEYSKDATPPVTAFDSDNVTVSNQPINYRFNWPGESAVIRYTTDGSTPNVDSPQYQNQGARRPGGVLTVLNPGSTTIKWYGTDMKGNVEAGKSQTLVIDQTAPTITVSNATEGQVFTQGQPARAAYSCADEGGAAIAECTGPVADGALMATATPVCRRSRSRRATPRATCRRRPSPIACSTRPAPVARSAAASARR